MRALANPFDRPKTVVASSSGDLAGFEDPELETWTLGPARAERLSCLQFSNSWTTSVQQHDTRSLQRALLAAEHSGPPSTGDRLPLRIQTTDRHSHPTEQQRLEAMYQSQLLLLLAQQQDQQHTSRVHR